MSVEVFEDFVKITECASTFSSLVQLFTKSMQGYGFNNLVLFRTKEGRLVAIPVAHMDEEIAEFYLKTNIVFEYLKQTPRPLFWNNIPNQESLDNNHRKIVESFEKVGATTGIAIPLPSTEKEQSIIFLTGDNNSDVCKDDLPYINAKCMQFWLNMNKFDNIHGVKYDNVVDAMLTPREIECLELCLSFESTKSIANFLERTEQTVQFHISNAIHKLGVQNRTQAVAKACILGLIGKSLK